MECHGTRQQEAKSGLINADSDIEPAKGAFPDGWHIKKKCRTSGQFRGRVDTICVSQAERIFY
jgi:hypothetical protein